METVTDESPMDAQTNGEADEGSSVHECSDNKTENDGSNMFMRRGQGWGRGIVADSKRTILTHWKEEMTIACSFFLYFACIAPAVTFGAIYGKATNNNIGAVEMITATSWCGIVYGLVGGQPMMINGGKGPVLAFTEILYKMSESMDVPFLTLNAWIGMFKFSPFLPNQSFRNVMTDFAVVISILIWSLIGNAIPEVPIEKLNVPDTFAPTFQCCDESCQTSWPNDCYGQEYPYSYMPWLVDLDEILVVSDAVYPGETLPCSYCLISLSFSNSSANLNGKSWVPFMAAGPALLAFILAFLDDGITWHLINHPTHKLKHGDAYSYDTLVTGLMILVNSLLGFPWLVAATVRSLNHVHAMAEKSADGTIISVHETRLTNLGIHLLCLVTIFALDVLKLIPSQSFTASSSSWDWSPLAQTSSGPSKYPVQLYTQYMKPKRMHLFTIIQLLFFAFLYVVKSIKMIAIAFPILIATCIPVRLYLLPKIFTEDELILIDSDPNTVKLWIANHQNPSEEPFIDKDITRYDSSNEDMVPESDLESPPDPSYHQGKHQAASPADQDTVLPSGGPDVLGRTFRAWTPTEATDTSGSRSADTPDEGIATTWPAPGERRRTRPSREEWRSLSCPAPNGLFSVELIDSHIRNDRAEVGRRDAALPTLY
ncbi:hypothetical protein ACHAWF_007485 [Thalassiosira exigua]